MEDFIEDLNSFLTGEGLDQFKMRIADQFRMDAPSKSGKSKAAISASQEGIILPSALWRVDEGRPVTDPSGVKLPTTSSGAGFIDEVLDNDLDIWTEIITEWCNTRSEVSDVSSG